VLKKKQDGNDVLEELVKKPRRIEVPEHNPTPKKRRGTKIGLPKVHVQDPSTGLIGPLESLEHLLEDTKDEYIVELIEEHPPTVKLIDIKEARASTLEERLRAKRKGGSEVQKEAQISWTMEPADKMHRIQKVREDLEKGNCKVDISFITKKRQRPPPRPEMQAKVEEVAESLEDVAKQWKPYALTSHNATLYLQSKIRVSSKVSREELMERVPKHIQQKEERKARAEKRMVLAEQERLESIKAEEDLLESARLRNAYDTVKPVKKAAARPNNQARPRR
jgi:translation initiation factor IF-3